ncbi:MAG: hypothetical protein AAB855_03505 [Patescibacteria group bacterium]
MPACRQCTTEFTHHELEQQLFERMSVPPSDLCLSCRRRYRLAFWPFGNFYSRTCDFSDERIITTYPPDTKFPVYKREHWYSDKWTPPEMDVDLERPFFDQLKELQSKTPHYHALGDAKSVGCDYADDVWESRNCYISRSMLLCEDMHYSYRNIRVKSSLDITFCYDLDQCYDCTYCFNSYNLHYSVDSRNCTDSYFLYDCRDCDNCFMSWNLRHKSYCILNKQYSPEEYKQKLAEMSIGSWSASQKLKEEFATHLKKDVVHKPDFNTQTEGCVGNFLDKCKNCIEANQSAESEDCYDVTRGHQDKDCTNISGLLNGELSCQIMQATNLYNVQYALYCVDCSNAQYLDQCQSCENCFGCVGLFKRKHCILNKQYEPDAYETLKSAIIDKMKKRGEYGHFFPLAMAYNGFNASLAAMHFPNETRESVEALGGRWEESSKSAVAGMSADQLPDHIDSVNDEWVGKIVECSQTKKSFNFIKQEIEFYKKHNIPLPHLYPDERNRARYRYMCATDPRTAFCYRCQAHITTYYPKEWGYEKIMCHECYRAEVL